MPSRGPITHRGRGGAAGTFALLFFPLFPLFLFLFFRAHLLEEDVERKPGKNSMAATREVDRGKEA